MAEKDYLVLTLGTRTKVILAWGSAVDCIQLLFIIYNQTAFPKGCSLFYSTKTGISGTARTKGEILYG